ncbi:PREDICTED: uncharacterized protein LOC101300326 [Fragaria vesca subsp. vesca]|uniref:uncharacterized protein LOC101300326 n=1 Tax=Fragaria vesca subsp. vesca TaxID=101020 RepID=UPI0002C3466D|nr:PREDICTED: uncharacterized protein LOC101300326 [Fragaria vesca subsp. vesca]XP_011461730.1 PREDICTED: uncharacterized protein LOC101300326 [Fragaria vesca subsp. vesca]
MRTTLTFVVIVAFVLISASLHSNAKRLTLKENHRQLLTDDRRQSETNAVPTAGVDSKDTKVDGVADQSKGSGDSRKSTGGSSSTGTKATNNDEDDDVNSAYKHYGGTGSNSDSSTDTHRYYSVDDRTGSGSNDDGRKPKH